MRGCALLCHVLNPAADLDVAIGIIGVDIESATGAPSCMLRTFTRPFAEFTRIFPFV